MTMDDLIDAVLTREGGFADHAQDHGGATNFGITAGVLGQFRGLNRPATVAEVRALPIETAREIYRVQYVRPFEAVPFDPLKAQLVDFGVVSGPLTAIRALQEVLRVFVDGVLGPRTTAALVAQDWRGVNNALVANRVRYCVAIVQRDATQHQWFYGWCVRAVSFYVP